MENTLLIKKVPFYRSWIVLSVFLIILIFQPHKATYYAFRPSDAWLMLCFFLKILYGHNETIHFRGRFLILNYGLILGVLAVIATIIQATFANLSLDISFIFHFYRFLRFLLIFKLVENLISEFNSEDANKFWIVYTLMGLVVLFFSFLEFNNIQPFKVILMNQYYYLPESTIQGYLMKVERLAGVMGNANATAILLVSTLPYPMLVIGNNGVRLITKIFYIGYILLTFFVLVVMTGSRTAIFISFLIPLIILITASRRLREVVSVSFFLLLLFGIGNYLYNQFESEIMVQERITAAIKGEGFQLSTEGLGKWSGRYYLWQDRINTFNTEGNQLSVLLGLGYTESYNDFADNGLLSAFINNGFIGLFLKLLVFYIFIKYGLLRAIRIYRGHEMDISCLAYSLSTLALLLWEITADLTEHYKLGQVFYLFLSISIIINAKIFSTKNQ